MCAWFAYPIIWILAEGTGVISANAEAICYTVLDVISKAVFGYFVVHAKWYDVSDMAGITLLLDADYHPINQAMKDNNGVMVPRTRTSFL